MPARIQKVLLTGKTHTTLSRNYVSQGGEERLDIRLSTPNNPGLVQAFEDIQPHPTAEQLFAGAWSACYTSALDVIAKQMKVQLPNDRAVDVEMTLTTPNCPAAGELPTMVENAVASVPGVGVVNVRVVWEPIWTPDRMSDEARLVLNMW